MALDIKKVEYYHLTVQNHTRDGARLLSQFAEAGINLLAFRAVTDESDRTRFTLFLEQSSLMQSAAQEAGLSPEGPFPALFIRDNEDESGDLAEIYEKLSQADIKVDESAGIAGINGGYGVVVYLKQEDCENAIAALSG